MNERIYQRYDGELERWLTISPVSAAFYLRYHDDPLFLVDIVMPLYPGEYFAGFDHEQVATLIRVRPREELQH